MVSLVLLVGLLLDPLAPPPPVQAPTPQASPSQAPPNQAAPGGIVDGKGGPSFVVPRIDEVVSIDGRLDEPAWSRAVRLGGFSEYQPVDSRPATERTEVLVWYSPKALHIGIVAFDSEPGSVRANVSDRDNIANDDWVRIFLDTFNDRRRAFLFGVNPLGVQEDGVHTEGAFTAGYMHGPGAAGMMSGTVDLSPDYQFDSKGRLTPEGYTVEVRIPFKSLRYPSGGPMTWGINVARKTQRAGRQETWTDAKRIASFLAQGGTMEGLYDLQRGTVTEVQPFITASNEGALGAGGRFARGRTAFGPGANVRLGFTNVSLDATANPDFSQVESDAAQVTVNERFALYYDEKRPFFLEGIELFATPGRLVYTRRIANPAAGAKVTGKLGRTGVALLAAADDTGDGHAWVTVGRVRRDIGTDSLAGVTFTDRSGPSGYNRVLAADARIVFKKLYYLLGQAGGSWTESGGVTRSAPMWTAEFDRTARQWGFNYKLLGYGTSFETQTGYVPRSNIVEVRATNRLSAYGSQGALLQNVSVFFGPDRIWLYRDFLKTRPLEGTDSLNLSATLRGGWNLGAWMSRTFAHFEPEMYASYAVSGPGGSVRPFVVPDGVTNWGGMYTLTTPVFRFLNVSLAAGHAGTPIYAEASDGTQTSASAMLGLRPTASIRIEGSLAVRRITRDWDGSEYAQSTIPRLKLEYQPRRSLFFRVVTEYEHARRSALQDPFTHAPICIGGAPAGRTSSKGLRTDWLVSFEPTPGTVAFFGYGSSLAKDPTLYNAPGYRRTTDGFFVKLAYMLRR
ncbi:MAG TPA: DUF5916 domain-containing protein [Vicinamibacterales bacterium]|nr:DUF5916 domain-containing protein [Vicinamibacterales bacterium]